MLYDECFGGTEPVKMPQGAHEIIEKLENHGYEAYIVGGCVRDMLLGRAPEDWDITTSAKPQEVKALFRRTVDTGIEHGTVTVLIGGESYEVTTYRMDGVYEDHRHPKEVIFTPSLEEDLKRRDFTINAMAYSERTGIVDIFDGQRDLEQGIIRCVGEPAQRFGEDALRMLRGVRFAGQLLFGIEKNTLDAIRELAPTLVNISAERIRVELTKLLISDGADRLRLAYETGLSQYFLPELDEMMACEQHNPHHCYTVGEHTIRVVQEVNASVGDIDKKQHIALAFAGLLHDVAKPACRTTDEKGVDHFHGHDVRGEETAGAILRRLKFDNDTIYLVKSLVRFHDARYGNCIDENMNYSANGKRAMRRLMNKAGREKMPLLFRLQKADILAQSDYKKEEKLIVLEAGERCYLEICETEDAVTIGELAIGGKDLIAEKGYPSGPAIGAELKRLLELVMDDPSRNTREGLLAEVKPFVDE